MNLRQTNLRVFAGEPFDGVFFQPRIEAWFGWHKEFGSLPEGCRGMGIGDLYRELGVSWRYFRYFADLVEPIETHFSPEVRRSETIVGDEKVTVFETPLGDLVEKRRMTVDRVWRKVDFAVKTPEDLDKLEWLFRHSTAVFNAEAYDRGAVVQGDQGQAQFWITGGPYETLTQDWMSFETFILALVDMPTRMAEVMDVIDRSYDMMFEQIVAHGDVRIVNFPENIHVVRTPPQYVETYMIPWYEKRCPQLRDNGIYTHIHIDGDFKPLLHLLDRLPFDGFEALTPLPQGDVTLEEIRDSIGDRVLLDGIPAVYFLDHHSPDELQECVGKLIEYFHPRLALGVSDELPQGAGAEGLERIRWIADYCRARED